MKKETCDNIVQLIYGTIVAAIIVGGFFLMMNCVGKFTKTRAGQKVESKLNYWLAEPNDAGESK